MDLKQLLTEVNTRLTNQGCRLKVGISGNKIWLRGTLPPKPNSKNTGHSQQRIYLDLNASPTGISLAESEAIKINTQLMLKVFNWLDFIDPKQPKTSPKTVGEYLELFEQDYFTRRKSTSKTQLTYRKDYRASFNKLDPQEILTATILEKAITQTPPDTRVRVRMCVALGALAKFAGISWDASRFRGSYSPKKAQPRDIPSDKLIQEVYESIRLPQIKWVFGAIATYGLRNHEVFKLDFKAIKAGDYIITVNDGKTGFRRIYPIYPEWYELFEIQKIILPGVKLNRSNADLGHYVSDSFRRLKLPFKPYDLRHAWAIRSLLFGLDVSLAAQMMGHSLKVHSELYHHWITEKHYEQAFKLLMEREDRPKPP